MAIIPQIISYLKAKHYSSPTVFDIICLLLLNEAWQIKSDDFFAHAWNKFFCSSFFQPKIINKMEHINC